MSFRLAAIITLSVIGAGCGPLYYLSEPYIHKEARLNGYELCHLKSCGPKALSEAFRYFGVRRTPLQMGREIQDDDHYHYRGALSMISHRFSQITCPVELLKMCKKYNFKITKKKTLNELNKNDIAIILIKGRNDLLDWHWIVYPKHSKSEINKYFEEDTEVKSIYILNEKKDT